ncbi:MAG TPA: hypothetical protein VK797_00630 [Tepidisphaeraceae bacterium]|jgi:hypothetical protein|nr:hypothetical protein [Tepidisphaeraceae bacterium]
MGNNKIQTTSEDALALYELERQMGVVRDRTRDVAARRHTSLYLYGPRGTSKTHIVRTTLADIGVTFLYEAGHLTPLGYFDLLRKHADEIIVIDDVSSLFANKIGQQMLLASLGRQDAGDSARVITYHRRNLEERVYFSGGLIAISNKQLHADDVMDAIKSRTKPLKWDPTQVQMAAMMRQAVKDGWRRSGTALTPEECRQVVDFVVCQSKRFNVPLDLRLLFDGALPDFAASKAGEHEADWRDHTTMAIREQVRQLEFSPPPKTRAEQIALEQKIAERIRAAHNTRPEQVEAWRKQTGKSERAFDRRSAALKIAK